MLDLTRAVTATHRMKIMNVVLHRKVNAQKFESAFYANPDLQSVHAPQEEKTQPVLDAQTLLSQLQQSPELLSNLTSLILAQAGR